MNTAATLVALDATTASEYDFIVAIDASGSMGSMSTRFPGKTRWEEMQETVFGIASELGKYDADGIDIVVFGSKVEWFEGVTADKVSSVFSTHGPRGSTPLGAALQMIADKHARSGKNTVAFVFTDGEPDNRQEVENVIVRTSNAQTKDEAISFMFVQIGNDRQARGFLDHLDNGLPNAKFDIVAALSVEESDNLSVLELINKAIND